MSDINQKSSPLIMHKCVDDVFQKKEIHPAQSDSADMLSLMPACMPLLSQSSQSWQIKYNGGNSFVFVVILYSQQEISQIPPKKNLYLHILLPQCPLGFSVAASVRVGNALGAGNTEQAKLSCKVPIICACKSHSACLWMIFASKWHKTSAVMRSCPFLGALRLYFAQFDKPLH